MRRRVTNWTLPVYSVALTTVADVVRNVADRKEERACPERGHRIPGTNRNCEGATITKSVKQVDKKRRGLTVQKLLLFTDPT